MHVQDPWWSLDIPETTVGIDLADRKSDVCILNARAEVVERSRVATTPAAMAAAIRTPGARAHRRRGGHALAVVEPPARELWP